MQQLAVAVEHEEMRIAFDPGPLRQEALVLVLLRIIDLDPDIARVDQGFEIFVGRNETVHRVTPRAPFTADIDDDTLVFRLGERYRIGNVLRRVTRRIESTNRLLSRACACENHQDERRKTYGEMKPPCNHRTSWFIVTIGSMIASTRTSTIAPIATISVGWISAVTHTSRRSASRSSSAAARSSIGANEPLRSPLPTR